MKNKKIFVILIILLIPSFWWLVGSGYYSMHDDLQVMRFFEMDKCFNDGQIPCRWSPDMVWGFGQPMFNFYSAFPYYFGAFLRVILPLTYLSTVKILFLLSFVIAGVGMFKLAKEFWGNLGGLLSSILYVYAPYHALDVYVRGALSEVYALSILPWMWFYLYKLIKKYSLGNFLGFAFSLSFILLSHNISTMIYAPATIIWCIFWLVANSDPKSIYRVLLSGLLGVGFASFFIIPALYEQKFIQTQYLTSDYFDFRGHFVTLKQLFISRLWGDGPSIYGDRDNLSFQIGWPHWWIGILAGVNLLYLLARRRVNRKTVLLIIFLASFTVLTAFLTLSISYRIWESIPLMSFVQFPWRFLGLTMFFLSFFAGSILLINRFYRIPLLAVLILLTLVLNIKYFIPIHYSREVTQEQKLTGVSFEIQQKSAILDYLPKTAQIVPQAKAFQKPKMFYGNLYIGDYASNSNSFSFDVNVYTPSAIVVPVMYFPGWNVYVDGLIQPVEIHGAHGLIKVTFIQGQHSVFGKFENTRVRTIADAITVLSLAVLFLYICVFEKYGMNKTTKR